MTKLLKIWTLHSSDHRSNV